MTRLRPTVRQVNDLYDQIKRLNERMPTTYQRAQIESLEHIRRVMVAQHEELAKLTRQMSEAVRMLRAHGCTIDGCTWPGCAPQRRAFG